jgi:hypothetical protein
MMNLDMDPNDWGQELVNDDLHYAYTTRGIN